MVQDDFALRNNMNIDIVSYNRVVLLAGEVSSTTVGSRILAMASQTAGVRRIHNELLVMPSISEEDKETDTLITTKVETKLITTEGMDASLTKVLTSKRVVYLMGLLTRAEALRVVETARSVEGVRQVVPLFEYVRLYKS